MINSEFAQIAWVVKDIKAAEKFFQQTMGVGDFHKMENFRSQDSEATYYGEPADFVTHTYQVYSGGTFIELIQPVSGRSVFQDFLDKNPNGGVQHVAFRLPIAEFDKKVAELSANYEIISTFNTTIAKIVYFDTYEQLGVVTELMGITKDGVEAIEKMKRKT